ncbi:plasmid stabilization system protein ParE [Rhizobium sp. PP-F2F-G48]|nr:plasmid stabilization system protein ParE [Rhizobium sp. PP-F2F-G48]
MIDLEQVAAYIGMRSPQGARRVMLRIKSLIEQLPDQPFAGARTEDPTIRRLIALPYPYLVFYEVTETEIIIHAVRHGSRDPAAMPGPT